jgi:predicted nuclease of predicted toxin-antitoxin system
VAGLGIRLYLDEMIPPKLALAPRDSGYDAIHCRDVGLSNQAISDDEQLAFAAQAGRAILTFNSLDFPRLDAPWKSTRQSHTGIIVSREISDLGTLLRRVQQHLDTVDPVQQDDLLLWLA